MDVYKQETLNIEAESFSEREKFLVQRLREHYTIDRDIREAEQYARGDNLPYEPSVTAAAPRDDDPIVKRILQHQVLKEGAREVVSTVQAYVSADDIPGHAAAFRVVSKLKDVVAATPKERDEIQSVIGLLTERRVKDEEAIPMTETERLSIIREVYIEQARSDLPMLKERRRIVQQALDDLERYYPEWWTILHWRYVRRKRVKNVCELAARDGQPLSDDEYLYSRKQALQQFDKWAVGLT